MGNSKEDVFMKLYPTWSKDWNKFAHDVCGVNLDKEQQEILYSIQTNRRTSVRSGTARGKDFVAAIASVCFLYLTVFDEEWNFRPTKVVNTAPTGRQITNIMIPEISKFFSKGFSKGILKGNMMADGIRFSDLALKDWFMVGFKADSTSVEAWSGIHAPNVMVVVTEASGIEQTMFESIEGILQGNSRLVLIFNPNRLTGEAYKSQFSPQYHRFSLNGLNAPNVINKAKLIRNEMTLAEYNKLHIHGQVDYEWVDEKVHKAGWTTRIDQNIVSQEHFDFEWNGQWYRPSDLFRVKVLGEFPKADNDTLIPLEWIEAAVQRWHQWKEQGWKILASLRLGADIAGMGRDNTVFCERFDDLVDSINVQGFSGETVHMQAAGALYHKAQLRHSKIFVDTIGEGAGVYSRCREQGLENVISAKGSYGTKDLTDQTGEYQFCNMRAYMYWAIRDWLNPAFGSKAALPPNDELIEELVSHRYKFQSNGKILIEAKEEIHKKIGRSPDSADSLSLTFFPDDQYQDEDVSGLFF